jgi:hypothetical protein
MQMLQQDLQHRQLRSQATETWQPNRLQEAFRGVASPTINNRGRKPPQYVKQFMPNMAVAPPRHRRKNKEYQEHGYAKQQKLPMPMLRALLMKTPTENVSRPTLTTAEWSTLAKAMQSPPPQISNDTTQQLHQMLLPENKDDMAPYVTAPGTIPEGTVFRLPSHGNNKDGNQMCPFITHENAALSNNPAAYVRHQQLEMLHKLPAGTTMQGYSPSLVIPSSPTSNEQEESKSPSQAAPTSWPLQQQQDMESSPSAISSACQNPQAQQSQMQMTNKVRMTTRPDLKPNLDQRNKAQEQDNGSSGRENPRPMTTRRTLPHQDQQEEYPRSEEELDQEGQEAARHHSLTPTGPGRPYIRPSSIGLWRPDNQTEDQQIQGYQSIPTKAIISITKLADSISLCQSSLIEQAQQSKEQAEKNLQEATDSLNAIKDARYTDPTQPRATTANELANVLTPLIQRHKACLMCRRHACSLVQDNTKPMEESTWQKNSHILNNPSERDNNKNFKSSANQQQKPGELEEDKREDQEWARQQLLDRAREDTAYHFQMTANSILNNCIWNLLHLTTTEREERMRQNPQEHCALPMPIRREPLRRLHKAAKSGPHKPPKRV